MKHNYLKHLFTALLMLCATAAVSKNFEIGGICYRILSEENKTLKVTHFELFNSTKKYTGEVVIPETVTVGSSYFNDMISTNKESSSTWTGGLHFSGVGKFAFDWFVSSESGYDWLVVTIDDKEVLRKSGEESGHYEITIKEEGVHSVRVEYIKDYSVSKGKDCGGIYNVVFGRTITTYTVSCIDSYAFIDCSGLTSITIPNSVTSIGNSAFSGCSGLTSITIPKSVTEIQHDVFHGCKSLKNVVFEDGTTNLGLGCCDYYDDDFYGLFYGCPLDKVYIGRNITSIATTSIGGWAPPFSGPLSYVEIGNNVTGLRTDLFKGCYNLKSIIFGNSLTYIGNNAFLGTAWYNNQPDGVVYAGKVLYKYKGTMPENSSITIKDGTISIAEYAFYGQTGLTSIEIPNSVTTIGYWVFSGCTSLANIEIPNSVTSIELGAFSGCTALKTVINFSSKTFSKGSSYNGDIAYYAEKVINAPNGFIDGNYVWYENEDGMTLAGYLGNATELALPADYNGKSVTSIGDDAFNGCTGLTSITIPNSVTSIGGYAFYDCKRLTSITSLIPADNLFVPGSDAFLGVDKTNCTLYLPYGAKETYAATEGWEDFENIVEIIPAEITITINEYGNVTFCSDLALDFSNVEGLKAYAATGYKSNSQVITLMRVQTAEAGVGLFLKGEPGEYVVPVIESTDEHSLNMLVGTLESTVVNSTDGEMSNYKFTIAEGDTAPMFYPFEDNTTLSAGKAYLQIPTAWLPATAQKSLSVRFDDGETTDIDELKGESGEVKTIYDLQGRVVENPTSGIYIIDGKKVLVK